MEAIWQGKNSSSYWNAPTHYLLILTDPTKFIFKVEHRAYCIHLNPKPAA